MTEKSERVAAGRRNVLATSLSRVQLHFSVVQQATQLPGQCSVW
jgi:hypothetical protein